MPVFWWMRLDLVFLVCSTTYGGVFWGVYELIMILVSLSVNEWGFIPVLLVVGMGCPAQEISGCSVELYLSIETEILGRALGD